MVTAIPVVKTTDRNQGISRMRAAIRGAVQGVGYRPFIYRLANELGVRGWVSNSSQGVMLEVEGNCTDLEKFSRRLRTDLPPNASIHSIETTMLDPKGFEIFEIRQSSGEGARSAVVLPDIAVCKDCVAEVLDPENRRYRYPFTNCTNCGPRYSIIESLPYDRTNTSMRGFKMCPECLAEYENPSDRRFHAQPNACPVCGPKLSLWDVQGEHVAEGDDALREAARALTDGKIVAVKGIGGFHLMADAAHTEAVRELRHRKHREEKPLAVMVKSLKAAKAICEVSKAEEMALTSPASPIVILRRRHDRDEISELVAPGNPNLGLMLAYTPLHILLLRECGIPLVATSGNVSDEPICIDESEALRRLGDIADLFLVHDRPIVRQVDDSIVRVMAGRETVLRRARGFAPLPLPDGQGSEGRLAVGAHLKAAVAASGHGTGAVVSQHIGDLDTEPARRAFAKTVDGVKGLYAIAPEMVVCDAHPDYFSTAFARASGLPVTAVQHHHAHILSCMAENELEGTVFGIAWDGTGYGGDGTVWGGEFLKVDDTGFERAAHLRQFRLPGGERSVKEPRRTALGLLYELFGDEAFDHAELETLRSFSSEELNVFGRMLEKGLNAPLTSSAGRLFDAVASLIGIRQFIRFEGQAAMELEFATEGFITNDTYEAGVPDTPLTPAVIDWGPMVRQIIREFKTGAPAGLISARFHNTLAEMMVGAAKLAGEKRVVLSGGCFQNKYLLERAVGRLEHEGFRVYRHQRVPPNDGGIALGQLRYAALAGKVS